VAAEWTSDPQLQLEANAMARAQSRAIFFGGPECLPQTATTTNEKARVHPASPAQDRGRQAMELESFIARSNSA
jgi:hypothetical protein